MVEHEGQTVVAALPRKRRFGRRLALPFLTLLLVLSILNISGSALELHASKGTPHARTKLSIPRGPYVQLPLSAAQINAIWHKSDHLTLKQLASLFVSRMTLDEKIGQLITVQYSGPSYSPDLQYMIQNLHAGGVILYTWQMFGFNQTKHDITQMQQHAKIPLFISVDEEGGYVDRLQNIYKTWKPSATEIADSGHVAAATSAGKKIASELRALGFNLDMAPDVDVQVVNGPDQLTRTFGTTSQAVETYAGAFMQALQSSNIVACIKHYPGLGAATIDAHVGLPIIKRTADQIYATELAPYRAFIQSKNKLLNPGMIMSTDLLMPAIDPVMPAELSPTFITDILRHQLGYDGVVTTDALYMDGISKKWSVPQAAVLALKAGNDMILGPIGAYQMQATINAIKAALQDGTLTRARIDEAVTRVITLKMQYHILPGAPSVA